MRIGTWNLAGRWSAHHLTLLQSLDCDVLLLTEVDDRASIPGMTGHRTTELMAEGRRWAAVFSSAGVPHGLADPHPASALAEVDGIRFCSSVLPWRSCGSGHPWVGERHADKTRSTVDALKRAGTGAFVWGGDWNQSLEGPEYAGSLDGRRYVLDAVAELGLKVATSDLGHRLNGVSTIDHVAVPRAWGVLDAVRVSAVVGGKPLSDHDAYVVEVVVPGAAQERIPG